jgi:hypothetical protein
MPRDSVHALVEGPHHGRSHSNVTNSLATASFRACCINRRIL